MLGLSWWKVSDYLDRYLAEKHGRPPTLRCNRTTWTASMCRERYLRQKATGGTKTLQATHRRCSVCKQTKTIREFSRCGRYRRRVCKLCRAVRSFTKLEEERRQALVGCLRQLARLANLGRLNSAQAEETLGNMIQLFGTRGGAVEEWVRFVETACHEKPGGRDVLNQLMLICSILQEAGKGHPRRESRKCSVATASTGAKRPCKPPGFSAWTDQALEAAIERYQREMGAKYASVGGGARSRARRSSRTRSTD